MDHSSLKPGDFCWAEVATVGAAKTKAFYSELFGWKHLDKPAGPMGTYTICQLSGKDVCGFYELSSDMQKMGVPPHWMSYVLVASADQATAKAKKLGATLLQGPFDVMDLGRMAILKDPTGATFSLWQAKAHTGTGAVGVNGIPGWFELATKGVEKAEAFYVGLFGWTIKKSDMGGQVYREISNGGTAPMGGMMELKAEHGPVPPHWLIYFPVDDCNRDVKRVQNLGGRVLLPPMDIPTVGRFSVLQDPAGAAFAIIQLSPGIHSEHKAST